MWGLPSASFLRGGLVVMKGLKNRRFVFEMDSARAAALTTQAWKIYPCGWLCRSTASISRAGVRLSGARKFQVGFRKVVECESHDVRFIQTFGDTLDITRDQVPRHREAESAASRAIADNPLESEFGSFVHHITFSSVAVSAIHAQSNHLRGAIQVQRSLE